MVVAAIVITLVVTLINKILFLIESMMGRVLDLLFDVFEVFAGIEPVVYDGEKSYLIDVFLSNSVVNAIYKGMCLIGIAMAFGFAITAVIKKSFDVSGEKVKATYGMIIGNVLKAILLMLLLTAVVSATVNATGVLMQQIDYLFDNAEEFADPSTIVFDDQDYAAMFRVIDTIGNYSLNPAYNNRININACFNAIKGDLQFLAQNKMFNYTYDLTTEAQNSWQAALLKIYNAANVYEELPIDQYNETVTKAILSCVKKIQTDANFKPLSSYYRGYTKTGDVKLGKVIMVASSFSAASNSKYNENPELYDSLRRPYMTGDKDIYSYSQASNDFEIEFGKWNHVVALLSGYMLIQEFVKMLINCIARIFNMMLLYITAPPFIAVRPLDDGGKTKQWTTAFVVQSLSVFATIIAIRLVIVFIPIVLSSKLVLFPNSVLMNLLAKILMVVSICGTAEKAGGMITGILTDNAGYQSVMAGDVGSGLMAKGAALAGKALSVGMAAGKAVGGLALKEAKLGGKAVGAATGASTWVDKKVGGIKDKFQSMRDQGGAKKAKASGWATKAGEKEKSEKEFKSGVLGKLDTIANNGNKQSPPPAADQAIKGRKRSNAVYKKGSKK